MASTAADIYQAFLDEISDHVLFGRAEAVAARMMYPQIMETRDGSARFDGPSQMIAAVSEFHRHLRSIGATEYHRICREASFLGAGDEISGWHTSYVMRGGTFLMEPFRSSMRLVRVDGVWLGAGNVSEALYRDVVIFTPEQFRRTREGLP